MKNKSGSIGFETIISIVIMVIVVMAVVIYIYTNIIETGRTGMDIAGTPLVEDQKADLEVLNDDANFNCSGRYVNVFNVGQIDADDVEVEISGAVMYKFVIVDLPVGAKLPIPFTPLGGLIEVKVDPYNRIEEVTTQNNNVTKNCP